MERKAGYEVVANPDEEEKKLETDVPASPQAVVSGTLQVAGGVVMRKLEVVVKLNGHDGRERTVALKGVIKQVQDLVRERKCTSWNVAALAWTDHVADEVLWRGTRMGKDTSDEMVMKDVLDDVTAVVGACLLRDSLVEHCRLRYVVVKKVPQPEWLNDGFTRLKGGAGRGGWGHLAMVVVSRVVKSGAVGVSVKVEVLSGEDTAALVKYVGVFMRLGKMVE